MPYSGPTIETECTLNGGGTVVFETPWTEKTDTGLTDPIEVWLQVMYTATETTPD